MTSYNAAVSDPNRAVDTLTRLSTDNQLAVLWYIYKQMGSQITPAAPGSSGEAIAGGLFEQVKQKPHQEQLEIQRNIVANEDTQISREYGALSSDTKLAFWYFLARGMDEETIIPMPSEYKVSQEAENLLAAIETMEFEQQITVLRESVIKMGTQPAQGSNI
ncbi:MAG: Orange carotenoid protein [Cyanobacteria bacterium QH_2_48_84]|nr:MAG: Orange carotenoid protein [Cyanobacteria bacterium QH_2_48_84]